MRKTNISYCWHSLTNEEKELLHEAVQGMRIGNRRCKLLGSDLRRVLMFVSRTEAIRSAYRYFCATKTMAAEAPWREHRAYLATQLPIYETLLKKLEAAETAEGSHGK